VLWLAWLVVALLALLPSLGTLDAPWIAEDAALLAQAHRDGPWVDWTRSQGGMEIVRFWRPVVSASWALQEAWTGIDPVPLRLFNLVLHVLASSLAFLCALRLGLGATGALAAGAWVATFPEQGGTCTWLAGRTDLLAAVLLLASVWSALGKRGLLSAPLAFLASATKEFGFLAPLWILALAWARGERGRALLARGAPAALAVAVALGWRTLVLGGVGGYPAASAGRGALLSGALGTLVDCGFAEILLVVLLLALPGEAARKRGQWAALALVLGTAGLLAPLLASGPLEPQNRRLLFVPECALALAVACAVAPGRLARLGGLVLVALLALRFHQARADVREWDEAARVGEARVERARASVAAAEPSTRPVLFESFPTTHGGAYCLGFGLAERFRAPFPESPRPVWPWRLWFVADPLRERRPLVAPRPDGSLWPLDDPGLVPVLAVRGDEGAPLVRLTLDERALRAAEDRSPALVVEAGPAGARLELLLITEHGYEPVPLDALDAAGGRRLTLMEVLTRGSVATAADVLLQAADLGSTRVYLELRALAAGEVLAASPWIELAWSPEFAALVLGAR